MPRTGPRQSPLTHVALLALNTFALLGFSLSGFALLFSFSGLYGLIVGLMQNAFAFLFPRLFFIGVFLTDHSVIAHPYHGGWVAPLAGFVIMPGATLAYASAANEAFSNPITGVSANPLDDAWGWGFIAFTAVIDLVALIKIFSKSESPAPAS